MSRKNLYVVMVAVFIFACSGKDKKVDIVDIADEAEASADIIEDNETFTEEDFTGYEMAEVKDSLEISKDVPPKDVPNDIAVPMCCGKDFPCPSNMTCAGSPEINKGSCKEKLTEQGKCWSFENCGEGEGCVGANLCPCDALCDMIDTPGECVKLPGGCCNVNGDCDEGFVCVQESFWLPGKCLTDPNGPECPGDFQCCWEDSDCGGGAICMGAYACGCIELCPVCGACAPDKMGVCTMTYEYNCCVDGYKCVPGQKCYNPGYNGASTCMKTPAAGQCWNNSDCAYDEECKLSAYCPCNADCGFEYTGPGLCKKKDAACFDLGKWDFGPCEAIIGVAFFNGKCETLSGCDKGKFKDYFFPDVETCKKQCGL